MLNFQGCGVNQSLPSAFAHSGWELLDIKRGAWPLEKVKAEAERLFQLAQEAYVRSTLPPEPDRDRAEKLCVKMIAEYHRLSLH